MTVKIVTVVGARPQFVKAAVVCNALAEVLGDSVQQLLIHTGQHYDSNMSGTFFRELGLADPSHNLEVGSGSHGQQTARMLEGVEAILLAERPDLMVVHGDTNSTLAGALAAAKLGIPVAHVEAGLRSFDRGMPEEINRVMADHLSGILFTPTDQGLENLKSEGLSMERVYKVGDVMYDAALQYRTRGGSGLIAKLGIDNKSYALATIHRQANTDDPNRLRELMMALTDLSAILPVVLPLHPRTLARLSDAGGVPEKTDRLQVIEPVGYFDMLALESCSEVIVTDSGGVQKEAYFAGKPCLVLRAETEWVELLQNAAHRLWLPGTRETLPEAVAAVKALAPQIRAGLYGDGQAGIKIARLTKAYLGLGQ